MKNALIVTITGLFLTAAMSSIAFADGTTSLRGARDLDKLSRMFETKKQLKKKGGIERAFKAAPPQIPHDISKDRVTLQENTCLKCHSAANYKREKAPKVGDSHFKSRDGKTLKKLSSRRYFCRQCHVPQVDAEPLVENVFKGLPYEKK